MGNRMKCPQDCSERTVLWFNLTAESQRHDVVMYDRYRLPMYKAMVRRRFKERLFVLRHGLAELALVGTHL